MTDEINEIKLYQTADGSYTCHSSKFDEHYHTKSGALEEAFVKHLNPVIEKGFFKNEKLTVLDFCFGLGYNSFAAMKKAKECGTQLTIVAIENDLEIIKVLDKITFDKDLEEYKKFILNLIKQEPVKNNNLKIYSSSFENIDFKLFLADARDSLGYLISEKKFSFDVVFFDPFSPSKCPDLWAEEIFHKVFSLCNSPSILTTYSCARKVRTNLVSAGFLIEDGPIVGRRSPSTLGLK